MNTRGALLTLSIVGAVVGCGASTSPGAPAVAAADPSAAPAKVESAPNASTSAASSSATSANGNSLPSAAADVTSPTPPATPASAQPELWAAPRFKSAKMGQVLLRCEAPEQPIDVAAGCLCGSTILSPCETRPIHTVDRRQCVFTCNVEGGNTSLLHCPDGAVPTKEPGGCGCGAGRVLTPCAKGAAPKSITIEGKECRVTCA